MYTILKGQLCVKCRKNILKYFRMIDIFFILTYESLRFLKFNIYH